MELLPTLRFLASPAPIAAKVSLISPALDPGSTTVEVWLHVENPKGLFKAGTAVHAVITGRTESTALLIPTEAIQIASDGTTKSVMVITADGKAHKRPVTLGIQTNESVQVLGGLTTADSVITTGAYGLDDGTKVKMGAADAEKPDASEVEKPDAGKKDDQ